MTLRHLPALVVLAGILTGFTHAALTHDTGDLRPVVRCYEDGSCDNGFCDPLAQCNEARQ